MIRLLLLFSVLFTGAWAQANEAVLSQLEKGLGFELSSEQAAFVTSEMQKVEATEKEPGEWFVLVCGGAQGGLMPAFPAGAQGALCTDLTGKGYWIAGLNAGLIGGVSAQLGAMIMRIYNGQPLGQYWALQGGSSLYGFGLGITYGMDFGNGNLFMRFVYAPGVAIDGTLSSIWINAL